MMKILQVLASVWLSLGFLTLQAQVMVKVPLRDYYEGVKAGNWHGDFEPHYKSETRIYYFEADFTGNGRKSMFITDDESRQGKHGIHGWTVYVRSPSGAYQRMDSELQAYITGPAYIGAVPEIKKFGAVISARHTVSVQYVDQGDLAIAFLKNPQNSEEENYPRYFAKPETWKIRTYTLSDLERMRFQ